MRQPSRPEIVRFMRDGRTRAALAVVAGGVLLAVWSLPPELAVVENGLDRMRFGELSADSSSGAVAAAPGIVASAPHARALHSLRRSVVPAPYRTGREPTRAHEAGGSVRTAGFETRSTEAPAVWLEGVIEVE